MRYAINSCIDVCISKRHIECNGVLIRVGDSLGHNFGLVCTRPRFAPGYLTSLTSLPADRSGRIVRREWSIDGSWRGQRLCSGDRGSLAAEALHNQVAQSISCSGQSDKALQSHGACRIGI